MTDVKNCGACGLDCSGNECINGGCSCAAYIVRVEAMPPGCQYAIPARPGNGTQDLSYVNLAMNAADASVSVLPRLPGSPTCELEGGGWYYDNPSNPTLIVLCAATCNAINSSPGTTVDVILGCRTG